MFLEDRNWVIDELHRVLSSTSADLCSAALEAFWDNPSASIDSVLFILQEIVRQLLEG